MRTNMNKCKQLSIIVGFLMLLGTANMSAEGPRTRQKESKEAQKAFASAKLLTDEDFEYDLTEDGNGIRLTKYIGKSSKIRIPDEIDDMPVVELGKTFFESGYYDDYGYWRTNKYDELIEVVYIPDSVEKICKFENFQKLKYIKLPEKLKEIPTYGFASCYSLEEIYIPDSVRSIGSSAFMCSGLKSIDFPNKVVFTSDSQYVKPGNICSSCHKLTSAYLPDDLTEIPEGMFQDCESLVSIEIPGKVTIIGGAAFYGCSSLSKIILPPKLTLIGNHAFYGCKSLSEFVIPNTVKSLGDAVFDESSVKTLYIPDTVVEIGNNKKVKENGSINLGNTSFDSLRLPDWMTQLFVIPKGTKVFNFPTSLKTCYLGFSLYGNSSAYYLEELEDIIIPDSLKSIDFSKADFSSAKLPIKTQKRLRDLGYTGKFAGTRPAKK